MIFKLEQEKKKFQIMVLHSSIKINFITMKNQISSPLSLLMPFFMLVFLGVSQMSFGQEPVIKNLIEELTEQTDSEADFSDLVDEYLDLMQNPLNINSPEAQKLIPLFLITEQQYQSLRQYIDSNGYLLSPNELMLVDGFTEQNIVNLTPFVEAVKPEANVTLSPNKIFKYGHHTLFLRYQRVMQESEGYKDRTDSVWDNKPNSKYLGNPDKYYLKYQFKFSDVISAGLVAEKDAGELFFENITNSTLDSLIGSSYKKGFDFYSYHLYAQKLGIVQQAVVGDYHVQLGQGLNMWSSLAFGKSSNSLGIKKFARGIKPNTSTDENRFLRGAALQLSKKGWSLLAFYSIKKQDASDFTLAEDQETYFIESLNGTGYHRTVTELLKKNTLQVQVFGSRVGYKKGNLSIGLIGTQMTLDKELVGTGAPYQFFNLTGTSNTVLGSDFQFQLYNVSLFAEVSHNINGGWAYMGGLNASLNSRLALALLYRNYQAAYNNYYGAAFGENTLNKNERGIYTGISFQASKRIQVNAYADIFSFPWLKFRVNSPSVGEEYYVTVNYDVNRKVQMELRARYKKKEINISDETQVNPLLETQQKYGLRYHISYEVHPQIVLKNRIEYQIFETETQGAQPGFLIFQDINFKSRNEKFSSSARFALFEIEDYDSRIYAYENDLLYAFSVPAYYNSGIRAYLLVSYKLSEHFQFWLKYAHTWYSDVDEIGSGLEMIDGNKKSEFRAQLRIKI